MSSLQEALEILAEARLQRSSKKTISLLNKAIHFCASLEKTQDGTAARILAAQIHGELAVELPSPTERAQQWEIAFKILNDQGKIYPESQISETYASLAVDCFQDLYCSISQVEKTRKLRTAIDLLDNAISNVEAPNASQLLASQLLSRKSSVLRHIAISDVSPKIRISRLQESERCAILANRFFSGFAALLELGLSEWALSRHEDTDESCAARLRRAEDALSSNPVVDFELGRLAFARFLRLTFRPLEACEQFALVVNSAKHVRRLYRESYIYAEAATQLWFAEYPKPLVEKHLKEARSLIEAAMAAGYRNARMITDLAFILAILEGPPAGKIALGDISGGTVGVDWSAAIRVAATSDSQDLLSQGFALGIDQGAVWTRLGTFARRFLSDDQLAEILYRAAIRLAPHDPIALTNLARLLIQLGDSRSKIESRRLLQQAQNFSDRRFVWWRAVLADLDSENIQRVPAKSPQNISPPPIRVINIKQITRMFKNIESIENVTYRGYELEKITYELAKLTFPMTAPSYRVSRDIDGVIRQIDGYFMHNSEKYRVECKWKFDELRQDDVVLFRNRLDVAGISGLMISMSGFGETAVAQARAFRQERPIILMDGDEARRVFYGHIRFDDILSRKRAYFDQYSEPYFKIVSAEEAA